MNLFTMINKNHKHCWKNTQHVKSTYFKHIINMTYRKTWFEKSMVASCNKYQTTEISLLPNNVVSPAKINNSAKQMIMKKNKQYVIFGQKQYSKQPLPHNTLLQASCDFKNVYHSLTCRSVVFHGKTISWTNQRFMNSRYLIKPSMLKVLYRSSLCYKPLKKKNKIIFFYVKLFHLSSCLTDNYVSSKALICEKALYAKFLEKRSVQNIKNQKHFFLYAQELETEKFFGRSFDKNRLKKFVRWFVNKWGLKKAIKLLESLKFLGFKYAKASGISLSLEDLYIPSNKESLVKIHQLQLLEQEFKVFQKTSEQTTYSAKFISTWTVINQLLKHAFLQYFMLRSHVTYFLKNSALSGNTEKNQTVSMVNTSPFPALPFRTSRPRTSQLNLSIDMKHNAMLNREHVAPNQVEKLFNGSSPPTLNPDRLPLYARQNFGSDSLYIMAFSGARGNMSQVSQLTLMRGLMSDPLGKLVEFPILSNFNEGLNLTEYLISCYGARKGIIDTGLRTATAGDFTRRLVDVAHSIIIQHFDCGTNHGIYLKTLKLSKNKKTLFSFEQRLYGRIMANHSRIAKEYRNKEITNDLLKHLKQTNNYQTTHQKSKKTNNMYEKSLNKPQELLFMENWPKPSVHNNESNYQSFFSHVSWQKSWVSFVNNNHRKPLFKGFNFLLFNGPAMIQLFSMFPLKNQNMRIWLLSLMIGKLNKKVFFFTNFYNTWVAKVFLHVTNQHMKLINKLFKKIVFKLSLPFDDKFMMHHHGYFYLRLFKSKNNHDLQQTLWSDSLSKVIHSDHKKSFVINKEKLNHHDNNDDANEICVRSPLTCNIVPTEYLCRKCYGWNAIGRIIDIGEAVGVLAAQSLGEPGTQLTLRTFHTGGIYSETAGDFKLVAPFDGNIIIPNYCTVKRYFNNKEKISTLVAWKKSHNNALFENNPAFQPDFRKSGPCETNMFAKENNQQPLLKKPYLFYYCHPYAYSLAEALPGNHASTLLLKETMKWNPMNQSLPRLVDMVYRPSFEITPLISLLSQTSKVNNQTHNNQTHKNPVLNFSAVPSMEQANVDNMEPNKQYVMPRAKTHATMNDKKNQPLNVLQTLPISVNMFKSFNHSFSWPVNLNVFKPLSFFYYFPATLTCRYIIQSYYLNIFPSLTPKRIKHKVFSKYIMQCLMMLEIMAIKKILLEIYAFKKNTIKQLFAYFHLKWPRLNTNNVNVLTVNLTMHEPFFKKRKNMYPSGAIKKPLIIHYSSYQACIQQAEFFKDKPLAKTKSLFLYVHKNHDYNDTTMTYHLKKLLINYSQEKYYKAFKHATLYNSSLFSTASPLKARFFDNKPPSSLSSQTSLNMIQYNGNDHDDNDDHDHFSFRLPFNHDSNYNKLNLKHEKIMPWCYAKSLFTMHRMNNVYILKNHNFVKHLFVQKRRLEKLRYEKPGLESSKYNSRATLPINASLLNFSGKILLENQNKIFKADINHFFPSKIGYFKCSRIMQYFDFSKTFNNQFFANKETMLVKKIKYNHVKPSMFLRFLIILENSPIWSNSSFRQLKKKTIIKQLNQKNMFASGFSSIFVPLSKKIKTPPLQVTPQNLNSYQVSPCFLLYAKQSLPIFWIFLSSLMTEKKNRLFVINPIFAWQNKNTPVEPQIKQLFNKFPNLLSLHDLRKNTVSQYLLPRPMNTWLFNNKTLLSQPWPEKEKNQASAKLNFAPGYNDNYRLLSPPTMKTMTTAFIRLALNSHYSWKTLAKVSFQVLHEKKNQATVSTSSKQPLLYPDEVIKKKPPLSNISEKLLCIKLYNVKKHQLKLSEIYRYMPNEMIPWSFELLAIINKIKKNHALSFNYGKNKNFYKPFIISETPLLNHVFIRLNDNAPVINNVMKSSRLFSKLKGFSPVENNKNLVHPNLAKPISQPINNHTLLFNSSNLLTYQSQAKEGFSFFNEGFNFPFYNQPLHDYEHDACFFMNKKTLKKKHNDQNHDFQRKLHWSLPILRSQERIINMITMLNHDYFTNNITRQPLKNNYHSYLRKTMIISHANLCQSLQKSSLSLFIKFIKQVKTDEKPLKTFPSIYNRTIDQPKFTKFSLLSSINKQWQNFSNYDTKKSYYHLSMDNKNQNIKTFTENQALKSKTITNEILLKKVWEIPLINSNLPNIRLKFQAFSPHSRPLLNIPANHLNKHATHQAADLESDRIKFSGEALVKNQPFKKSPSSEKPRLENGFSVESLWFFSHYFSSNFYGFSSQLIISNLRMLNFKHTPSSFQSVHGKNTYNLPLDKNALKTLFNTSNFDKLNKDHETPNFTYDQNFSAEPLFNKNNVANDLSSSVGHMSPNEHKPWLSKTQSKKPMFKRKLSRFIVYNQGNLFTSPRLPNKRSGLNLRHFDFNAWPHVMHKSSISSPNMINHLSSQLPLKDSFKPSMKFPSTMVKTSKHEKSVDNLNLGNMNLYNTQRPHLAMDYYLKQAYMLHNHKDFKSIMHASLINNDNANLWKNFPVYNHRKFNSFQSWPKKTGFFLNSPTWLPLFNFNMLFEKKTLTKVETYSQPSLNVKNRFTRQSMPEKPRLENISSPTITSVDQGNENTISEEVKRQVPNFIENFAHGNNSRRANYQTTLTLMAEGQFKKNHIVVEIKKKQHMYIYKKKDYFLFTIPTAFHKGFFSQTMPVVLPPTFLNNKCKLLENIFSQTAFIGLDDAPTCKIWAKSLINTLLLTHHVALKEKTSPLQATSPKFAHDHDLTMKNSTTNQAQYSDAWLNKVSQQHVDKTQSNHLSLFNNYKNVASNGPISQLNQPLSLSPLKSSLNFQQVAHNIFNGQSLCYANLKPSTSLLRLDLEKHLKYELFLFSNRANLETLISDESLNLETLISDENDDFQKPSVETLINNNNAKKPWLKKIYFKRNAMEKSIRFEAKISINNDNPPTNENLPWSTLNMFQATALEIGTIINKLSNKHRHYVCLPFLNKTWQSTQKSGKVYLAIKWHLNIVSQVITYKMLTMHTLFLRSFIGKFKKIDSRYAWLKIKANDKHYLFNNVFFNKWPQFPTYYLPNNHRDTLGFKSPTMFRQLNYYVKSQMLHYKRWHNKHYQLKPWYINKHQQVLWYSFISAGSMFNSYDNNQRLPNIANNSYFRNININQKQLLKNTSMLFIKKHQSIHYNHHNRNMCNVTYRQSLPMAINVKDQSKHMVKTINHNYYASLQPSCDRLSYVSVYLIDKTNMIHKRLLEKSINKKHYDFILYKPMTQPLITHKNTFMLLRKQSLKPISSNTKQFLFSKQHKLIHKNFIRRHVLKWKIFSFFCKKINQTPKHWELPTIMHNQKLFTCLFSKKQNNLAYGSTFIDPINLPKHVYQLPASQMLSGQIKTKLTTHGQHVRISFDFVKQTLSYNSKKALFTPIKSSLAMSWNNQQHLKQPLVGMYSNNLYNHSQLLNRQGKESWIGLNNDKHHLIKQTCKTPTIVLSVNCLTRFASLQRPLLSVKKPSIHNTIDNYVPGHGLGNRNMNYFLFNFSLTGFKPSFQTKEVWFFIMSRNFQQKFLNFFTKKTFLPKIKTPLVNYSLKPKLFFNNTNMDFYVNNASVQKKKWPNCQASTIGLFPSSFTLYVNFNLQRQRLKKIIFNNASYHDDYQYIKPWKNVTINVTVNHNMIQTPTIINNDECSRPLPSRPLPWKDEPLKKHIVSYQLSEIKKPYSSRPSHYRPPFETAFSSPVVEKSTFTLRKNKHYKSPNNINVHQPIKVPKMLFNMINNHEKLPMLSYQNLLINKKQTKPWQQQHQVKCMINSSVMFGQFFKAGTIVSLVNHENKQPYDLSMKPKQSLTFRNSLKKSMEIIISKTGFAFHFFLLTNHLASNNNKYNFTYNSHENIGMSLDRNYSLLLRYLFESKRALTLFNNTLNNDDQATVPSSSLLPLQCLMSEFYYEPYMLNIRMHGLLNVMNNNKMLTPNNSRLGFPRQWPESLFLFNGPAWIQYYNDSYNYNYHWHFMHSIFDIVMAKNVNHFRHARYNFNDITKKTQMQTLEKNPLKKHAWFDNLSYQPLNRMENKLSTNHGSYHEWYPATSKKMPWTTVKVKSEVQASEPSYKLSLRSNMHHKENPWKTSMIIQLQSMHINSSQFGPFQIASFNNNYFLYEVASLASSSKSSDITQGVPLLRRYFDLPKESPIHVLLKQTFEKYYSYATNQTSLNDNLNANFLPYNPTKRNFSQYLKKWTHISAKNKVMKKSKKFFLSKNWQTLSFKKNFWQNALLRKNGKNNDNMFSHHENVFSFQPKSKGNMPWNKIFKLSKTKFEFYSSFGLNKNHKFEKTAYRFSSFLMAPISNPIDNMFKSLRLLPNKMIFSIEKMPTKRQNLKFNFAGQYFSSKDIMHVENDNGPNVQPSLKLPAEFSNHDNHFKLRIVALKYSLIRVLQKIVNNVQAVYRGQGVDIYDQHIEVLVSQMGFRL